jgi:predicted ArsR family transcriptional regulator
MVDTGFEAQAERYAVLSDGQRRAIYGFVRAGHRPVSREEVAAATGVSRSLAAFHLERLLDAGLVTADYARPEGRTGPGAGRPAKRYAASDASIAIEIPPRRYSLVGRLLVRAVEQAGAGATSPPTERAESARDAAMAVAADEGRRLGAAAIGPRPGEPPLDAVAACLETLGFEPVVDDAGEIVLANCPFHDVALEAPELVCGMNQALVAGVLDGLGVEGIAARLAPREGRCCVVLS